MLNPDAIADAAAQKAAAAPHGSRRDRQRVAKKARLVALAMNVKAMRISMRTDDRCGCDACASYPHASSCAVHNMPAYQNGPCNCNTADPFGREVRGTGEGL